MRISGRTRAHAIALGCAMQLPYATTASAMPEGGYPLSDDGALMGGAVIATGRDVASSWYNPALLGSNRRNHIDVSATVYGLRRTRAPAGVVEIVDDERRRLAAIDQQLIVVPSAFSVATALKHNITLGFGVFTSSWYEPDIRVGGGGLVDADAYTYLHEVRILGVTRRHNVGPMLGWSPVPGLQLGLSVLGIYDKRERMSRVFASASSTDGAESTHWATNGDDELRSFGGQVVLGIRGQLGRWVQAGAVLRTPALAIHQIVSGSEVLFVTTVDGSGDVSQRADLQTHPARTRPGPLAPWSVGTGLGVGNDAWRIALDGEASTALRDTDGTLIARPVWNLRLGTRYRLSRRWTLGAGAFTDRSTVAQVRVAQSDVDLWGGSFGVQYASAVRLASNESARRLIFRTTVAARYAGGVGRFGQLRMHFPNNGASAFAISAEETTPATVHFASLYVGTGLVF